MNILVENNCCDLLNMGDVAMLQVAVERLRQLWPEALIRVITSRSDLLRKYCPTAEAVPVTGRSAWFYDRSLFGKMHSIGPRPFDIALSRCTEAIRRTRPSFLHNMLSLKAKVSHRDMSSVDLFIKALFEADLLVVSGGGDINDEFMDYAFTLLEVLEVAARRGIPAVMFGQGIGPINSPALRARARTVLPTVRLLGVRERLVSPVLLEFIGVSPERVRVSGDDAIELPYRNRGSEAGSAIGINIRASSYSMIDVRAAEELRNALGCVAASHRTSLLPVPISFYPQESDIEAVKALMSGSSRISAPSSGLDDPLSIIREIGRCRIVITGSYHSAVFALSQGIPAIALARSLYYRSKFLGLMDQFDTDCSVLSLDDDCFPEMLIEAAERAWELSGQMRPGLLSAAERQIVSSKDVYDDASDLFESRHAGGAKEVRQYVCG
jgi:polysaccharide pyruvyl transferase WcaK-like protein